MPQLHAAYCIPEILAGLSESAALIARALLHSLAHFELDADRELPAFDADQTELASLLAVALNLTSRGLPTRAPLALSEAVLRATWPGETSAYEDKDRGAVGFMLTAAAPEFQRLLVRALHVTEPRLTAGQFSETTRKSFPLDSQAEHRFLSGIVAGRFGVGLAQALLPQVPLAGLLRFTPDEKGTVAKALQADATKQFFAQHVDFALPLPYAASNAPAGLVLEVDGPHHKETSQKTKDSARVKAAQEAGWQTDRLPVEHLDAPDSWLTNLLHQAEKHPYCRMMRLNYNEPLHATEAGRRAEQLMLTPVLAARIHRALLEAVAAGILQWNARSWRVTIIEHDVPGGHLGAQAFTDQLTNLFALEGKGRALPPLEVVVYTTPEYATCALHEGHDVRPLADYLLDSTADLLLDVSMLARPRLVAPIQAVGGVPRFVIRTSGLPLSARRITTAPLVRYAEVCQPDPTDEYLHEPIPEPAAALRFFLRDIFRKADFRPGQLPILKRGLRAESVLGLLPTGGGKSLTYQLAGLLQPGVSLVVDPIKSLMQDQYEGLLTNWIDAVSFINSSVFSTAEQRLARLTGGETLFFFLSPERLQIKRFRDQLRQMSQAGARRVGFSFCVVDEAHCVSEWGHDFRTQYLRLGETVRRFCKTHDQQEVPIYGLTATASFDVLADVQRELAMPDQDAIVRTRTTRRRELRFRVLSVPAAGKHGSIKDILGAVPTELADWSAEAATKTVEEHTQYEAAPEDKPLDYASPPKSLDTDDPPALYDPAAFYDVDAKQQYAHAGLIFCPHKSAKVPTGVESVLTLVKKSPGIEAGKFTAGGAEFGAPDAAKEAEEMMQTQRDFIGNKLNLLVATKAFGMGIDKPNVRFTIHYCYPGSIESLVQEAGRAGRDRAVALNYILFDPADAHINESFFNRSFRGRDKEMWMIKELLNKVSLPAGNQLERLREVLMEEFEGAVITPLAGGLWPKKEPHTCLYVNQGFGQKYGFVGLGNPHNLTINTAGHHATIPTELATRVLNRIVEWIQEEAPPEALNSTALLVAWLREETEFSTIPGILPTLAAASPTETNPTLVIGFKNGEASRLVEYLGSIVPQLMIWQAAAFATDGKKFAGNFREKFKDATGTDLTKDQSDYLAARFERLRDEQDTYKAVHRLTLLGVVHDYTLDYGAKTITLHLNRTDESEYNRLFTVYIDRYTTKAKELAAQAALRPLGESLLEKLLGELLDFTYREIADKRQRATKEMALACEKGVAEPDEDLGEFFDLYFNSKYARAEYLPEHTHGGTHFDRALLWQYLGYVTDPPDGLGKERDNVKHLRGACARMLSSGADKNGAVLLLDGFALLFLEAERKVAAPKILAAATEKLLLGFGYYREQENLTDDALLTFFDDYTAGVGAIEPEVAGYLRHSVRELLLLDVHRRWLRAFNDRFDDRPAAGNGRRVAITA